MHIAMTIQSACSWDYSIHVHMQYISTYCAQMDEPTLELNKVAYSYCKNTILEEPLGFCLLLIYKGINTC